MSEISDRTDALADVIAKWEARDRITPPLTPDERDMAFSIAAAYLFWHDQTELPARAPRGTAAWVSFWMGVYGVLQRRERAEGKEGGR
jgi:hypothetical protein